MTRAPLLRRGAALLTLLAGVLGAALLFASPASAHATVVSTSPADGSRLTTAPKSVSIVFDENVGLGTIGYLHVTDQTGRRVDARAAYHPGGDGSTVRDDLVAGLGDGTYTASFRVVSADSHPVAGTIAFVVGNGALVRGHASGPSGDSVTSGVFDAVRWVTYAGLALLGGGWLVLTVWPAGRDDRRARRLIWTGWGAAVVGAVLELLLQGAYAAGESVAHVVDWRLIDATLHSDYGQLHSARLVLLGVLAVVLARSLQADAWRSWRDPLAGALVVAAAVTISAGGHADTTSPSWLSIAIDVVHLSAMATWIGGLIMLGVAVLPRREPDELEAVVPVFSTVAFVSVVLLAGSGTYSAWRGIGSLDAILQTTYGLLVVAKIVLFLGIVAVANVSRQLVRTRAVAPDPAAPTAGAGRLRRAVAVEAVIGLVVLVLSAVLVNEPRGREALDASYRKAVSSSADLGGGHSVTVGVDPGVHGTVNVTITLNGTTATSVTAAATQNAKEIGPVPVKLTREGGDTYDGSVALPVAGKWEFDLVVTQSTFNATSVAVDVTLH